MTLTVGSTLSGRTSSRWVGDFYPGHEIQLWKLRVDSLLEPPLVYNAAWSDATTFEQVAPGERVDANLRPTTSFDTNVALDSMTYVIHYDGRSLNPIMIEVDPPAEISDSSVSRGRIQLTVKNVVSPPSVHMRFATALSDTVSLVVLDSVRTFGSRKNCGCTVQSIAPPYTMSLRFTGCGTTVLSLFLQTGQIFDLLSVSPNPASTELRVALDKKPNRPVEEAIVDLLGHEQLRSRLTESETRIDVSSLKAGLYMLRVFSDGEVRTRTFVISR